METATTIVLVSGYLALIAALGLRKKHRAPLTQIYHARHPHPLGTPLNGLSPTETLYMRIGTFDWTSFQTKLHLIFEAVSGTDKLCFNEANIAI